LVAVTSYLDLDNRQIVSQANKLLASRLYFTTEVQAAPHQDTPAWSNAVVGKSQSWSPMPRVKKRPTEYLRTEDLIVADRQLRLG
jgi:hypothetical protein